MHHDHYVFKLLDKPVVRKLHACLRDLITDSKNPKHTSVRILYESATATFRKEIQSEVMFRQRR